MAAITPLLGILEFERDPISFNKFGTYAISWLQDAGGFAAVGLLLWTIYVLLTPRPTVVGSRRVLISRFMAITGVIALISYLVALGMTATILMNQPENDGTTDAQAAAAREVTSLEKWQGYTLAIAGFFALLSLCEPFFVDLYHMRWRRIYAIAKLSFKEAVRAKVVWVFLLFLLVFLFPANWFVKQKPEDQLKQIINVSSTLMAAMLILMGLALSAFRIPNDIRQQTIYTIVTKPIERFEIVIGRFLGYLGLMTAALFGMTAISLVLISTQNLDQAAIEESKKARSPIYGTLTFRKASGEFAGIDVGREYTYRRYIPGIPGADRNAFQAIWNFTSLSGLDLDAPAVPCEFAFDVYRTIKGRENEGVRCTFIFTTWKWNDSRRDEFDRAARAAFGGDGWKSVSPPPADDPTDAEKAAWEKINKLAEEFGRYEYHQYEVVDYHTRSLMLPPSLIKNALDGTPPTDDPNLKTPEGISRLRVSVRCESPGQFIGVAPFDLYLLESEGSFSINLFKGAVGLWCRLAIAIGLAVVASTYLSGVVSFFVALFVFLSGSFLDFIRSLAEGTNVGGGPFESFTRLVRGDTSSSELDVTPTIQVLLFADRAFRWLLRRIFDVIPDTDRFSWGNYVGQGFNIPFDFMILNLIFLVGYMLPWAVLAYYLMRSREVAA